MNKIDFLDGYVWDDLWNSTRDSVYGSGSLRLHIWFRCSGSGILSLKAGTMVSLHGGYRE